MITEQKQENKSGTMGESEDQLRSQNELLKAQLMNASLINELMKVMQSCTDPDTTVKTMLLGIQEIVQFDRIILFTIDRDAFELKPTSFAGFQQAELDGFSVPLGFEGGEITDSVFLNRHIVVEQADSDCDPFASRFDSHSYLVIPLLSKATKNCWEAKDCGKQSCPAYHGFNPYCWSVQGAGDFETDITEDERRRTCVACSCFRCTGVFWMDRRQRRQAITSDDITILTTIINQSGIVIENLRIFNELEIAYGNLSQANNQLKQVNHDLQLAQSKIKTDLNHARMIQQGLLPQNLQDTEDFQIGATYIPASEVGGDYYDLFEIEPHIYGLIVADVSGHGIASALIMSMAKILLKTLAINELSPQKTMERINRTFLSEIKTDNFVTMFYAVIDTESHVLRYSSAGHCPILFLEKESGTLRQVNADGLFLGVFPDMMLAETSHTYAPGKERLVLYTDGLTEAQNNEEVMYDISRLEKASLESLSLAPRKAMTFILDSQKTFCGKEHLPEDDITLLVLDL